MKNHFQPTHVAENTFFGDYQVRNCERSLQREQLSADVMLIIRF